MPSEPIAPPERIVIATRESRLALWQAEHVRSLLQGLYPACRVELLGMTTRGDQILDRPLAKVGGKGLFVKELETALLDGSAHIAVHSMKDVPMEMGAEFALVAIGPRETPLDAFVSNKYASLDDLPPGAVVGTSSLRREAQLHANYPYLAVTSLRGNLDTRLRKLDEGQYDAIILAAAGLTRLGLGARIRGVLAAETSLPAAGQGALGIEALAGRADVAAWLSSLNDAATAACVRAERAVSRALAGSCEVPLGAFAEIRDGRLFLRGFVATPDGQRMARAELTGDAAEPEALGLKLAAELRAQGADEILASLPLMDASAVLPLAGRHIVITRPAGQAVHLAEALTELGAKPVLFPVLAIFDVEDIDPLLDVAIRLDQYDWAAFVSPNAVEKALAVILPRRAWPASLRVATMGHSSEEALARFGITGVVAPRERLDSEALVALPELQDMAGKRVIIFRGDGGRELLGDTLKARGGTVDYVTCYRRRRPDTDPATLLKRWGDGQLDAVTLTSSEGLRNLWDMLGPLGQSWLRQTPVFVPHARIAEQARALGLHEIITTGPGDDGLVRGLVEHFRAR